VGGTLAGATREESSTASTRGRSSWASKTIRARTRPSRSARAAMSGGSWRGARCTAEWCRIP